MSGKHNYTPEYIHENLFLDDLPVRTKFGMVHGSRGSSAEMVRFAAGACLRGEVDTLVFSGGARVFDPFTLRGIWKFNSKEAETHYFLDKGLKHAFQRAGEFLTSRREALLMADIAIKEGVDHRDIIVEGDWSMSAPRSQHTGQNVDALLEDDVLRNDILKAGGIKAFGLVYNTRRICGTWQRKLEDVEGGCDVIIVPRSFYPYGFSPQNWPKSDDIRERIVYAEMAKIDSNNDNSLLNTRPEDVTVYDAEGHRDKALAELPHTAL